MSDRLYLPHSEQFDKMNGYLEMIARGIGSQIYEPTWRGVQNAVRSGVAPELYPVGTQFVVHHEVYGDHLYDVVAHDHYKSATDENAHTMTLLSHDSILEEVFDAAEAMYHADSVLSAGTYNFINPATGGKLSQGSYEFTLSKDVPKDGLLKLSILTESGTTVFKISSYSSQVKPNTPIETVYVSEGQGGINLGTLGVELNDYGRLTGGSNNYKESFVRQFLNSDASVGSIWRPQTKFDLPPSSNETREGFLKGLDEEFLSVIGKVIIPCSANIKYESPDSETAPGENYELKDLFYLPSHIEIYGQHFQATSEEGALFPYYRNAISSDFFKRLDGYDRQWALRTPPGFYSYATVCAAMATNGMSAALNAVETRCIAPACNIV